MFGVQSVFCGIEPWLAGRSAGERPFFMLDT